MDKIQKKRKLILNIIVFAAVLIVGSFFYNRNVSEGVGFNLQDGVLDLSSGDDYSYKVSISDIADILITDSADLGEPISGGINRNCRYGIWYNDEWGNYKIIADINIPEYLVLQCQTEYYVFNYESKSTTESLYTALKEYIDLN